MAKARQARSRKRTSTDPFEGLSLSLDMENVASNRMGRPAGVLLLDGTTEEQLYDELVKSREPRILEAGAHWRKEEILGSVTHRLRDRLGKECERRGDGVFISVTKFKPMPKDSKFHSQAAQKCKELCEERGIEPTDVQKEGFIAKEVERSKMEFIEKICCVVK